ncbi:Clavaminate synthase-like protein [Corynespora cassiicola Philippines]|uniref:Clavaminate synthase-like protein n=1 Tax=Corynespora cassiicola Philippines TaxID=1448308 RepID=A0A2T2NY45_CORCC|nr:Clavaminate synthase-like protein [Corynespora cassiicola Philippines]
MPVTLQKSREHLRSFSAECERVGHALLQAFSIGLGLPKQFLSKSHTGEQNRFRMLHYPPVTAAAQSKDDILVAEDEDIRAGAHSDYGSLTLLFQEPGDAGGLQVWYNSAWLNVPYVEKAIVVNIGDALEFWTAGRLRSTIHRVTFPASKGPTGSRYSIPFFMAPDDDAILEPLLSSDERHLSDAGQEFNFGELAKVKGYQSLEPVSAKEHRLRREANIGSSKKA